MHLITSRETSEKLDTPEDEFAELNLTAFLNELPDANNCLISFARTLDESYTQTFTIRHITRVREATEKLSQLEMAAIYGQLHHVSTILAITSADNNSHEKVAAFYRALENKNLAIAQYLLGYSEVIAAVEMLTVDKIIPDSTLPDFSVGSSGSEVFFIYHRLIN
ncbi:MAG: hypothetical protein QNK11_07310 [Legionella sp.]|nr:hypothetical protein [Legionella sp.]